MGALISSLVLKARNVNFLARRLCQKIGGHMLTLEFVLIVTVNFDAVHLFARLGWPSAYFTRLI